MINANHQPDFFANFTPPYVHLLSLSGASLPTAMKLLLKTGISLILAATVSQASAQHAKIIEIENIVQTAGDKASGWTTAGRDQQLAVGNRIRTRQRSRATISLTDLYTMRMEQFTTIELTPALVGTNKPHLDLKGGGAFIFSREQHGEIDIKTPAANGALRGTQLFVQVSADGHSRFQVLEGAVEMANAQGKLLLSAGEAGEAIPGQAPRRTAVIEARNLLQWALYYPAIIDPSELGLTPADTIPIAASLAAYRSGNLLGALERYPSTAPQTVPGKLYQAAVLLAVGRTDETSHILSSIPASHPARRAIERTIAAAKFKDAEPWPAETLTTAGEAIAESYHRQSRWDLAGARQAALRATKLAPGNGYAWTRLAELEFSFGNSRAAGTALENALSFTPLNAQAHALQGFVHSAANRIPAARASFERATQLDGALANGWLGLGLAKIKRGDLAGGRADLQTAATVEPTSSIHHSYLSKAFSMEKRAGDARKDLDLAVNLDPADPTPHLYSALELQLSNRTNEAIRDLEKSISLNDNRRVYRSQLLLDQDRAVRSANLAKIYQNAGMRDVAVREATRAVESDYLNPSAHLFLANSFDALRDPNRIALRYETPWFNELLLANLLSPVGGGSLSQFVSQQEYSKLLEADGIGGSLATEFRSDGESRTSASLFGTSGDFSFGLDTYHRETSGYRENSDASLTELYGQLKWQPTPDDSFYFLGKWSEERHGDLFETYDNLPLAPGVDFSEAQHPGLLLAGWNHRWSPGSHTLVMLGRLSAEQRLEDPAANQYLIERDATALNAMGLPAGSFAPDGYSLLYPPAFLDALSPHIGSGDVLGVTSTPFDFYTRRSFEIYSAEIQHVLQTERNLFLAGARFQHGEFETVTRLSVHRPAFVGGFATPAAEQDYSADFQRLGLYAYDYWQATSHLTLIGGLSWDRMEHPENFRNPPINDRQETAERLSAKLGFTYTPSRRLTLRGMYAQGLGGVTYDESVRLEPVQLAGFNQAFRTAISESIAGSIEAPRYEIIGLGIEGSLPTRTWWGISLSQIEQDVNRGLGAFTGYNLYSSLPSTPAYFPDTVTQHLSYRERSLSLTLNQLIDDEFSVGAGYRLTHSRLRATLPDIPAAIFPGADVTNAATLHELSLHANWNSPHGFFARLEANWYKQDLDDHPTQPARSGDSFWQLNAFAGYRFNRNLGEISLGVLNIGDTGYQLSPLNPYSDIPRERTAVLRCRVSF